MKFFQILFLLSVIRAKLIKETAKQFIDRILEESAEEYVNQQSTSQNKKCNFNFLRNFINTSKEKNLSEINSVQNIKQVRKLCGIKSPCCLASEIEFLFSKVKEGFEKYFQQNFNQIEKLQEMLQELRKDYYINIEDVGKVKKENNHNLINNYIDENETEIKNCIASQNIYEFRSLIGEVVKQAENYQYYYKEYAKKTFLEMYKIQCGICDLYYSQFFQISNFGEEKGYHLDVKMDEQIKIMIENLTYLQPMQNLITMSKILNCSERRDFQSIEMNEQLIPLELKEKEKNLISFINKNAHGQFFKKYLPGAAKDLIFINIKTILIKTFFDNEKYLIESLDKSKIDQLDADLVRDYDIQLTSIQSPEVRKVMIENDQVMVIYFGQNFKEYREKGILSLKLQEHLNEMMTKDLLNNFNLQVETNWIPLEVVHRFSDDFREGNVDVNISTRYGFYSNFIEVNDSQYENHFLKMINEYAMILQVILCLILLNQINFYCICSTALDFQYLIFID